MSFQKEVLLGQQDMERLAREAGKIYGIAQALDAAILESSGTLPADMAGAFDAIEDIARGLATELSGHAEYMGVFKDADTAG